MSQIQSVTKNANKADESNSDDSINLHDIALYASITSANAESIKRSIIPSLQREHGTLNLRIIGIHLLTIAVSKNSSMLVKLIIDSGVIPFIDNDNFIASPIATSLGLHSDKLFHMLFKLGCKCYAYDASGNNILHILINKHWYRDISRIIERWSLSPLLPNKDGETCFTAYFSYITKFTDEEVDLLNTLHTYGARANGIIGNILPNIIIPFAVKPATNVRHYMKLAQNRSLDKVGFERLLVMLYTMGTTLTDITDNGENILMIAINNSNVALTKALLSRSVLSIWDSLLRTSNRSGEIVLHYAIRSVIRSQVLPLICRRMRKLSPRVKLLDNNLRDPILAYASIQDTYIGYVETEKALQDIFVHLPPGYRINNVDITGRTLLSYITEMACLSYSIYAHDEIRREIIERLNACVKLLLDTGAQIDYGIKYYRPYIYTLRSQSSLMTLFKRIQKKYEIEITDIERLEVRREYYDRVIIPLFQRLRTTIPTGDKSDIVSNTTYKSMLDILSRKMEGLINTYEVIWTVRDKFISEARRERVWNTMQELANAEVIPLTKADRNTPFMYFDDYVFRCEFVKIMISGLQTVLSNDISEDMKIEKLRTVAISLSMR